MSLMKRQPLIACVWVMLHCKCVFIGCVLVMHVHVCIDNDCVCVCVCKCIEYVKVNDFFGNVYAKISVCS